MRTENREPRTENREPRTENDENENELNNIPGGRASYTEDPERDSYVTRTFDELN